MEMAGTAATLGAPRLRRPLLAVALLLLTPPAALCAQSCPLDMVAIEDFCIDRWEAPNQELALPLVMYTFTEAAAWCEERGRRLCFDDEWTRACEGSQMRSYPYGDDHVPGRCNDEETWIPHNQSLLSAWPSAVSSPDVASLAELLDAARAVSPGAEASADHVEDLYQGEGSGSNAQCVSADGVLDLVGNVEEWTRRREGGTAGFDGNHKGRYWAESRTCQDDVVSHGNAYRFYELGFRCCLDQSEDSVFADGFESGDLTAWSSTAQ